MRIGSILILALSLVISCSKIDVKVDIVGNWLVQQDCDTCMMFEFDINENLIVSDLTEDEQDTFRYVAYQNSSIFIEDGVFNENYNLVFHDLDNLDILEFSITPIPEERNTILKRLK